MACPIGRFLFLQLDGEEFDAGDGFDFCILLAKFFIPRTDVVLLVTVDLLFEVWEENVRALSVEN